MERPLRQLSRTVAIWQTVARHGPMLDTEIRRRLADTENACSIKTVRRYVRRMDFLGALTYDERARVVAVQFMGMEEE